MLESEDDTYICPRQHPHFPHLHSHGMPFSADALLDDVCITSADFGCLPLINSYDESIVDNLIWSQSQIDSYNYVQIAEQNTAWSGLQQETLRFPTIHDDIMGAFKKWNPNPYLKSLPSKRGQSIHKRCIRLLNDISNHRIDSDSRNVSMRGDVEINVRHNYDKLAIHHVIAERRRREDMNEMFSTLRGLLPLKTKVFFFNFPIQLFFTFF